MTLLNLTPDEVLTTTRSVRKRLDLSRPVEPEVIRECLEIALQAPSGSNTQMWHFVVVTDDEQRKAIGDIYKRVYSAYHKHVVAAGDIYPEQPERQRVQNRITSSADYLGEHMGEVPVLLIPCIVGRPAAGNQAGFWGSILPATWSFMLAARERGLGTAWTSMHLAYEKEVADIIGLPYEKIAQAALIPVAYTIGTDFKPASREPLDSVLHWNRW
jgi:nitroreductase